jgi:hypothetical protein
VPAQQYRDLRLGETVFPVEGRKHHGLFELAYRPAPVQLYDGGLADPLCCLEDLRLERLPPDAAAGPEALEPVYEFVAAACHDAYNRGYLPVLFHRLRHGVIRPGAHDPKGSVSLAHLRYHDVFDFSVHHGY